METATVDIRKLQLLNECIHRTIDALNQVRLSVHAGGLSHSAPVAALATPYATPLNPYTAALAVHPFATFATNPFAAAQLNAAAIGATHYGLGHTAANPWTTPYWAYSTVNTPFGSSFATPFGAIV